MYLWFLDKNRGRPMLQAKNILNFVLPSYFFFNLKCFRMDVNEKFKEVSSNRWIVMNSLKINKQYSVLNQKNYTPNLGCAYCLLLERTLSVQWRFLQSDKPDCSVTLIVLVWIRRQLNKMYFITEFVINHTLFYCL